MTSGPHPSSSSLNSLSSYKKKNFYEMLNIESTASQKEIKTSYNKLVLKYHPDKNINTDTTEKFRDIHMAYEVLSNTEKRKEYDNLNIIQQSEFYDSLKDYFEDKFPAHAKFWKKIIKKTYGSESDFKSDLNNLDFSAIFNKITSKIDDVVDIYISADTDSVSLDFSETNKSLDKSTTVQSVKSSALTLSQLPNLDIKKKLITTLKDKYLNKYSRIKIERKSRPIIEFYIPLRESILIYDDEGEYDSSLPPKDQHNKNKGKLTIEIICNDEPNFIQLEKSNILTVHNISLEHYLYGGKANIKHIDNTCFEIKHDSFVELVPVICIKGKGLPISNFCKKESEFVDTYDKIERGDLYVHFKIKHIENPEFINAVKKIEKN
jgi:DnaJ-class molecular chaperone